MLELHVWGPAFGLPSLDAHCLAAIAYLQQAVPRGKWCLIASSNPGLSPTNELPALRNDDIWIGGFRNIFHYIAQYSAGEWVLDAGLPEQEGADCIAFSSFLDSQAQPLLDLSLYVSSQNYSSVTRPLYNTIQTYPLPYLTPPSRRAQAKSRTAHLGLSGLDIDSEDLEPSPDRSIVPESLRRPKNTVSSLLASSPEATAQIRLDALATDVLEPLSKLIGKKQYMVSDSHFTSLDCLALGYLSLMLFPELPQPWLSKVLSKKFPSLCKWTEELRESIFGREVTLSDAFLSKTEEGRAHRGRSHLPWKANETGGVIGTSAVFLNTLADSMPGVGMLRRKERMRQHGGKTQDDEISSGSWRYAAAIGGLVAGAGGLLGYLWSQGLLGMGDGASKSTETGSSDSSPFGGAEEMLGIYAHQLNVESEKQHLAQSNYSHGEPVSEVEIEVERVM